ncbi:arylsulfatase [Namhaeicola litoreus]|uniref:Arylsulfatase n=1 Tax=Namhaeicola litoreus TaxID=1052145 RepID=A0ABW3Y522_9FLAO
MKKNYFWLSLLTIALTTQLYAQQKPNIIVIWGDDLGVDNVSAYHRGMVKPMTPNIDRIANEGALMTDAYAQQSCTAGRAAFIMGQHPFRTGMLTIGMPGAKEGIRATDMTIADMLKNYGYATAQIGKNHLGDRNEFLPTVHGFDRFYGNLYHLNSEEEPEDPEYPKDPEFDAKYGPRGVLESYATSKTDATEDPRWGKVGNQTVKDHGPLTKKKMETVEMELLDRSLKFIDEQAKSNKPFFLWHNSTRMHVWTHLAEKWVNSSNGGGLYGDGMMELDYVVGKLLDKLDELGIADNTIVVFSTDNGAEMMSWPDGGTSPFKGEKGTTWEGGFRVPQLVRWPGKIPAGSVVNGIFSHEDWMPTLAAAVGEPNLTEKVKSGYKANGKTFKNHLDGYNQLDMLMGKDKVGKRREIFYFDAGGNLNALRYDDWKVHFSIIEGDLTTAYRKSPSWPIIVNMRQDPYERAPDESRMYLRWQGEKMWTMVPAQSIVAEFIESFKAFPPAKSGSLSVDKVLQQLTTAPSN